MGWFCFFYAGIFVFIGLRCFVWGFPVFRVVFSSFCFSAWFFFISGCFLLFFGVFALVFVWVALVDFPSAFCDSVFLRGAFVLFFSSEGVLVFSRFGLSPFFVFGC